MKVICTYNHGFKDYIFKTLSHFDCKVIEEISENICIINTNQSFEKLYKKISDSKIIFFHHIQPINFEINLTNDFVKEIDRVVINNINGFFDKDKTHSIQIRTINCNYSKQEIISSLEDKIEFKKDNKNPEQVISIFINKNKCFIGFSETKYNLSKWNGGEVRYSYNNCISRAEFKLMELFDFISIEKFNYKTALDLGCAPGGWSKVLLDKGLKVVGVDPAQVDKSLLDNKNFTHFNGLSENFKKINKNNFDIIVNDMKIGYKNSIKIIKSFLKNLNENGIVIMTIKLFKNEDAEEAINTMKDNFQNIILIKQLYHNRSEFTVVLK